MKQYDLGASYNWEQPTKDAVNALIEIMKKHEDYRHWEVRLDNASVEEYYSAQGISVSFISLEF